MSQAAAELGTNAAQLSDKAKKMLRTVGFAMVFYCLRTFLFISTRLSRCCCAGADEEFGLTATALGVLSSMYFYPYAAMQIPSGVLSTPWDLDFR